jgi:hypothetical protein
MGERIMEHELALLLDIRDRRALGFGSGLKQRGANDEIDAAQI